MTADTVPPESHIESRWPPAIALIVVTGLVTLIPDRIAVLPLWFGRFVGLGILVVLAGAAISRESRFWVCVERTIILVLATVYVGNIAAELGDMVGLVTLHPGRTNAFSLLMSAIAIWLVNVLVFSLLYWQMDRGGPKGRRTGTEPRPDWAFPQPDDPGDLPPGWKPRYLDYLFLSYNTSTAFSPTDAAPLTQRAKVLMMLESAISMLTLVVVVSRAINVLPG